MGRAGQGSGGGLEPAEGDCRVVVVFPGEVARRGTEFGAAGLADDGGRAVELGDVEQLVPGPAVAFDEPVCAVGEKSCAAQSREFHGAGAGLSGGGRITARDPEPAGRVAQGPDLLPGQVQQPVDPVVDDGLDGAVEPFEHHRRIAEHQVVGEPVPFAQDRHGRGRAAGIAEVAGAGVGVADRLDGRAEDGAQVFGGTFDEEPVQRGAEPRHQPADVVHAARLRARFRRRTVDDQRVIPARQRQILVDQAVTGLGETIDFHASSFS